MKTSKSFALIVLLVIGGWCSVTQAELYKCLDKNGKAKYQADKCPVTAKVSIIKPADKVKETVQENKKAANNAETEIDQQIKATTELYDAQIADLEKHHLSTALVEEEKNAAIKKLMLEKQVKAIGKNAKVLKNEAKLRKETATAAQNKADQLRKRQQEIENASKQLKIQQDIKETNDSSTY
jgi:hypothetical protein